MGEFRFHFSPHLATGCNACSHGEDKVERDEFNLFIGRHLAVACAGHRDTWWISLMALHRRKCNGIPSLYAQHRHLNIRCIYMSINFIFLSQSHRNRK